MYTIFDFILNSIWPRKVLIIRNQNILKDFGIHKPFELSRFTSDIEYSNVWLISKKNRNLTFFFDYVREIL